MDILPDRVQHAGCDALSPGQTEDPDPTDPTQRLFRDGGAAPGSVPLHEVVFRHVFESIWLLQDSVSLEGQRVVQSVTSPLTVWDRGNMSLLISYVSSQKLVLKAFCQVAFLITLALALKDSGFAYWPIIHFHSFKS